MIGHTFPPYHALLIVGAGAALLAPRPVLAQESQVGLPLPGVANLDTVRAGRFDAGKMWTFDYPPTRYFSQTYGFQADSAWFARARLAVLRLPGCSASIVSPHGLVVTNHHCVRGAEERVSLQGEDLLRNGFYARSSDQERRLPGYYADQLIAIEDVSQEVFAALDKVPAAGADSARRIVLARIEGRTRKRYARQADSLFVQIVPLYGGGRYSTYVFRRYTDVRLVAAVELQMGFFGGDSDNFTYPRYDLDFAFLRLYGKDGKPLDTDHYFRWSQEGVEEGDVVFVIGNPGRTSRLATVAQLEYQRDVQLPAGIAFLNSRLEALAAFRQQDSVASEAMGIENRMFGLSNSLKLFIGQMYALEDPVIMAKRRDAERALRDRLTGSPDLKRYTGVLDSITALQKEQAALSAPYGAFFALGNPTYGSSTLRRALLAYEWLKAQKNGASADSIAALRDQLLRAGNQPPWLDRRFLTLRLEDIARTYGASSDLGQAVLPDGTPEASAAALLAHSALADSLKGAAALAAGSLSEEDPAIRMVTAIMPAYTEYQQRADDLSTREQSLTGELGRARFELYGTTIPPDGTFSPRITDGVVKGYAYNGSQAPAHTTFYGLYDRHASFGPHSEWELPERWKTPPAGLELSTPLDFVSTADTYGGNSGSPVVTPGLELVGLNFDRNIEGLSRAYIYLPERGRNVMVDVRGIRGALDHVYGAHRIVEEITAGDLQATEADAAGSQ